ncbi:MAG: protein-glutamate O-methyltransferase CheR [Desulfobacterales bacterium]|nr:protein-glutamate O-methyltransferase CheR [Desulfobacterales bacterium]
MLKITEPEFLLMKQYIEDHCGIHLQEGKEYLIESRLSDLVIETGSNSFQEFHLKTRTDSTGRLKERIIDAMTTNETYWFRDDSAWEYIREKAVPNILDIAKNSGKARIWSSAASTGQEAYSLLMLLDEAAKQKGNPSLLDKIEIIGTDISSQALLLAQAGRYSSIAMGRGLPKEKTKNYFTQQGTIWILDQSFKKRVTFKKFNLQDDFMPLGLFDLILCRNVIIYFSDKFKKSLFSKLARVLKPKGVLILGASETLRGFSDDFDIQYYKNAVLNIKK